MPDARSRPHRPVRARAATLAAACAGLLLGLLLVSPAQADAATPPSWSCRASAASGALAGLPRVEPVAAGALGGASPAGAAPRCSSAETGGGRLSPSAGLPAGIGVAAAATSADPEFAPTAEQTVAARARAADAGLDALGLTGLLQVGLARSEATGRCVAGRPVLDGSSTLTDLRVLGRPVSLDELASALADAVRPLGLLAEVDVNERLASPDALTVRPLRVRVLREADGAPLLELVLAESRVAAGGAVCDGGAPPDPGPDACPTGSALEGRVCVLPGGTTPGGVRFERIVLGRPAEAPSGGAVVALPVLKELVAGGRLRASRCLKGPGPRYALLGTDRRDRLIGTDGRDRILALGGNDRAHGAAAGDCLDGSSGADRLYGGEGADRLHGGAGNDAINGSSGADAITGGAGRDTINAGHGADRVDAGAGGDAINVAAAGPLARVRCGSGRDVVRWNRSEDRRRGRGSGCERRLVLPDRRTTRRR